MRTTMKVLFAALVVVMLSFTAAGAQTLTIGMGVEPVKVDPADISDNPSETICHHIYDGLIGFKKGTLELENRLAESYEVSEDGKTWVFKLRKGISFHSGNPLNAEAVKHHFDRVLTQKLNRSSLYAPVIDSVEVLDEYTVQMNLKMPFGPFPYILAHTAGTIVDPASFDEEGNLVNPSGTGPFKFESWEKGEQITLVANKDYFKGAPKVEKIVWKIIPEDTTRTMMLETGELDVAERLSTYEVERIREIEGLNVHSANSLRVMYIGLSLNHPILADKKVRQAIAYAIDRAAISKSIMGGYAPLINTPTAFDTNGYVAIEGYEYDPEKAAELLDEAGWKMGEDGIRVKDGRKMVINQWTCSGRYPMDYKVSEAVQAFLSEVGIKTEMTTMEWATYLSALREPRENNKAGIFYLGWSPSTGDADWVLRPNFHSDNIVPVGSNRTFYSNERVDELIEIGMTETDQDKRRAAYKEAQEIISEEAPWVVMFVMPNLIGSSEKVENLAISPLEMTLVTYETMKK